MTTSFQPIARSTAVDQCEAAIRARILRGDLEPGQRLPPERALADSLGVNRVTVRNALGRLASSRLLSVRQGSGYVIQDFRREGGLLLVPELAALAQARSTAEAAAVAEDLLLVRRQLARAVLLRLSERVERRALARVDATIGNLTLRVESGAAPEEIAAADVEVLRAVVAATGREVLSLCMNPVIAVLEATPLLVRAIFADGRASVLGWRALRAWMSAPDPRAIDGVIAGLEARDELTIKRLRRAPRATRGTR